MGRQAVAGMGQGQVLGLGRRPDPASDAVFREVQGGDAANPVMQVVPVKVVDHGKAKGMNLPGPGPEGRSRGIEVSGGVNVQVGRIPQDRFADLVGTRRGIVGMFEQPLDGEYAFVAPSAVPGDTQLGRSLVHGKRFCGGWVNADIVDFLGGVLVETLGAQAMVAQPGVVKPLAANGQVTAVVHEDFSPSLRAA